MVKVKEVKHSDEEVSSDSGSAQESGEFEVDDYEQDGLIPMDLGSEEGEEEYSEEEDGEMEFMELAEGESQSETNSQDMEDEYVAEMMSNEKEMKKLMKEAKANGLKSTEEPTTNDDEEESEEEQEDL